jgi:2-methylcitrate dehydratase
MVAVAMIFGDLKAEHYEDEFASNPLIDQLREKFILTEDPSYTKDYLDADKRSIANAIQVEFEDGSKTEKVEIHYPIGHRRRRQDAYPLIEQKFLNNISTCFDAKRVKKIKNAVFDQSKFEKMKVSDFVKLFKL